MIRIETYLNLFVWQGLRYGSQLMGSTLFDKWKLSHFSVIFCCRAVEFLQKIMGSRTFLWKLIGLTKPIKPLPMKPVWQYSSTVAYCIWQSMKMWHCHCHTLMHLPTNNTKVYTTKHVIKFFREPVTHNIGISRFWGWFQGRNHSESQN